MSEQSTGEIRIPPKLLSRRSIAHRAQLNRAEITATKGQLNLAQENLQQKESQLIEAQEASATDGLTGVKNARWFEEELTRRVAEASRQKRGLWVIYADIDHFKDVNDRFGHPKGDEVLKTVKQFGAREEEPLARIGGEEFAQVIEDGETSESVQSVVSRYSTNFRQGTKNVIGEERTLSFGIVQMQEGDTPQTLRDKADKALYFSKKHGRNQATMFTGTIERPRFNPVPLTQPVQQPVSSTA